MAVEIAGIKVRYYRLSSRKLLFIPIGIVWTNWMLPEWLIPLSR